MIKFNYNVHNELKNKSVLELQEITAQDRLGFNVFLFNLEYDLNIGNIIRASHCLGVNKVIVLGNQKVDSRGCVGSHNYTEVQKVRIVESKLDCFTEEDLLINFDKLLKENNCFPILIEKVSHSCSITDENNFSKILEICDQENLKPCLVFGNENKGIPEIIIRKYLNNVYHIEQRGVIRSMNVSSAASIAIHETGRHILKYTLKNKENLISGCRI